MAATSVVAVPSRVDYSPKPGLCALVVMGSDFLAVFAAMVIAVLVRHAFQADYDLSLYGRLSPVLFFFMAGYAVYGLYPGIGLNAVRELRQLTFASTLVFIVLGTLMFLFKEGATYSRSVFVIGWLLALVLVPLARLGMRSLFGAAPWWGYPVAVFGSSAAARSLIADLQAHPEMGLHPVAAFHEGDSGPAAIRDVPVLGDFHAAPLYARRMGLKHAIVAMPDLAGPALLQLLESQADLFSRVYVMPGLTGFSSLGIQATDVGNSLTLQLNRSLLLPSRQFAKRITDLAVSIALGIALTPVLLVIAALIRLESRGNVLFFHKRVGHGGRRLKMWKFRTMYVNGDQILEEYLCNRPAERQEWAEKRKLRNDPRVTKVGRILRKASLDELPQLWNVFRGQMSLVGPRPIVGAEVPKYREFFELYCRVVPGLTGLWQVSGRSDTGYDRRVELDSFYVRNWTPWLDIYLLARTVKVVLKGEGAY
jgi:Undecaprenyl-phosphate galactose phosphotransferase WbaP